MMGAHDSTVFQEILSEVFQVGVCHEDASSQIAIVCLLAKLTTLFSQTWASDTRNLHVSSMKVSIFILSIAFY